MGMLPSRNLIPLPRRARHARHGAWRGAISGLDARVAQLEQRLAGLDRRIAAIAVSTRLGASLAASALVHAFVIFGISFALPDKSALTNLSQPLEVVLVNARSQAKPPKADALAQHNLDGGGNTDAERRAKSPLPVTRSDSRATELALAQSKVEQLEREARRLLAQRQAQAQVEAAPPQREPQNDARIAPNANELMQKSLEIARLEAQIAKDWDAYQQRPRRRYIGARTQEFRFARYIEDWRAKIERVGEVNYPQAARDQRIYGSLVVTVSIKADGSLERVDINRSSGQKILDEAALRIVQLASPYAPFPADIAKDTDILSITRTWLFTRSDRFVSE
jgi:protein TonB